MRAVEPTHTGHLPLAGFRIGYETFGDPSAPAVLLLPTWQGVHSRLWKMQVHFLARRFHVIAYDSPGNGLAERTAAVAAFEYGRIADQGLGLLDRLGVRQAAVVAISRGCWYALDLAGRYPERITRLVLVSNGNHPDFVFTDNPAYWVRRETYEGDQKENYYYCREHFYDFLTWLSETDFNEPHSTKAREDFVAWGLDTTPEILAEAHFNPARLPKLPARDLFARVHCPVLMLAGDQDHWIHLPGQDWLSAVGSNFELVTLTRCGHIPNARDPVRINLEIERFLDMPQPKHRSWQRAMTRPLRALFISSPIGLGHVQRDLAIARALRQRVPELQIEWLAQPPVTRVLEQNGEAIHPLSQSLASESAHWESTAGEHQLHCFYAWREMDELLLANFMVFLDAVRKTPYDLWIGDEAWEVDYYLHENPELKTAPFVFLTDFLGWVPVDRTPGSREAFLTADYNAEMIEHVRRFKRVRDRSLYIGDYDDLLPERFGPDLPLIQDWARDNFTAAGYVVPFDPADYADTRAVRARLGYDPDQPLVVVAVGGTAVGQHLLHKAVGAWPLIHRARPDARCVVVAGPRIAPASLAPHPALEVRPYVHNLYEHLAVADLGVVQGGLSTTMELAVNRRPFLYFPLQDHCEQEYHVAHRLDRYRAGRRLRFAETSVEDLAEAALATLQADTSGYRPYTPGGAERAAALIAELL